MDYRVHTPSPDLQPFVKCFWTLDDVAHHTLQKQRIVPDGCMEMIFHYGDPYRQYFENGDSLVQPRCFIFGQITSILEIAPTGVTGVVAARFHPHGLDPLLPVQIGGLEDKATALDIIFGDEGAQFAANVLSARDNAARIAFIEVFLLSRLRSPVTTDFISKSCVDAILATNGHLDISELSGQLDIKRRKMERRFRSTIGLSPKQLSRAVRLQAAIRLLTGKKFSTLTDLALESGYFDQAHFIKDFREFTGTSPKSFFSKHLELAGLFANAEGNRIRN
jgi:AraC-like DNA-binding protein